MALGRRVTHLSGFVRREVVLCRAVYRAEVTTLGEQGDFVSSPAFASGEVLERCADVLFRGIVPRTGVDRGDSVVEGAFEYGFDCLRGHRCGSIVKIFSEGGATDDER